MLSEDDLRRILREELRALAPPAALADRRVTTTEAAAAAGVSPATLRHWVEEGKLRQYGEGRNQRYSLSEVLAVRPAPRAERFSPTARAAEILRGRHG